MGVPSSLVDWHCTRNLGPNPAQTAHQELAVRTGSVFKGEGWLPPIVQYKH